MTKFLDNQHLLVKYGDLLCNCPINANVTIHEYPIPIYDHIPTNDEVEKVHLNNLVGIIKLEKKEDGIYYTPKIFNNDLKDFIEYGKRDYLKFACIGGFNKVISINASYIIRPTTNFDTLPLYETNQQCGSIEHLDLLIGNLNNSNIPVHTSCTNPEYDYGTCIHIIVGNTELQLYTNEDNSYICGVNIRKTNV